MLQKTRTVIIHNQGPNVPPAVQIQNLVMPEMQAELAREILGHIIRGALASPQVAVKVACDAADELWQQFDKRGWLLAIPDPTTLNTIPFPVTAGNAPETSES